MNIKAAVLALLALLVVGYSLLRAQDVTQSQAQSILSQIQSLQEADDLSTMVQAVEMTTPAPASSLPNSGTFWSAQHAPGTSLEWPPLPANTLNLDAWPLGDENFLLNDTNENYDSTVITPQTATSRSGGVGMSMEESVPPVPGGGSTNSIGFNPNGTSAPVNYSTNLWIAQFSLPTNNLIGIASNTLSDVPYAVQSDH